MRRIVFRLVEALIVGAALAVLTIRSVESDDYGEYRRAGGRNGFWSWFAREKCGVALPGAEDRDAAFAAEREAREKAKAKKAKEAKLARLEAREKELVEAEEKELKRLEAVRKMLAAK